MFVSKSLPQILCKDIQEFLCNVGADYRQEKRPPLDSIASILAYDIQVVIFLLIDGDGIRNTAAVEYGSVDVQILPFGSHTVSTHEKFQIHGPTDISVIDAIFFIAGTGSEHSLMCTMTEEWHYGEIGTGFFTT